MTTQWTNKMDWEAIGKKWGKEMKARTCNNVERYFLVVFKGHYTYLLNPWIRVLLEKLTGFQLVKKFHAFYATRRLITPVTSAHHLSLFWASSIQSMPIHSTSWRFILILSFRLCLNLPSDLFPSGFPTKTLYKPLPSPIRTTWALR